MEIEKRAIKNNKKLFEHKAVTTELLDLLIELPWTEVKHIKKGNKLKFHQMFNELPASHPNL